MTAEIVGKELSYQIVQAAYKVFNTLGPGFMEKIYREAMVLLLRKKGHAVDREQSVPVFFQEEQIGTHILNIVVDQRVILELKASAEIVAIHKQQALSYLKATGLPLAIIINFGAPQLQVHRVVRTRPKEQLA